MERMIVYVVRLLERLLDVAIDMPIYSVLLVESLLCAKSIMEITSISERISDFDSIFSIFIFIIFIFLIFTICCAVYTYLKFIKYSGELILRVVFFFLIVYAALYVLKRLDGWELVGYSLSELFEYMRVMLGLMGLTLLMFGSLLFLSLSQQTGGHRINKHFNFSCSAIKRLEKINSNEINNYKDIHTIHSVSIEYTRGIREIQNLLIRGIDLNKNFFDLELNVKLSLNGILDWLTFSMQYYLFYGGHEQLEAVKNHLERMAINFDEEYHIDTDQFIHEILRMYNEINIYFKENNIDIARSTKLADRIISHLPQVLLAIVLLIISMITKDFIIN